MALYLAILMCVMSNPVIHWGVDEKLVIQGWIVFQKKR